MYDFWLSPGISHPTGNKSDIKRERLGPNIYASHMAQVIEKTQIDAYIDFVAKYPDIKIGQRTFDKLKPFFVRPASEKDRNTCCCRYHIESNLLFKSCMKFRKSKNQTTSVEKNEIQSNYFQRTECILHVTIIHKHAILEYDGLDSTDDFPEIIAEHFFVISPDLQHDHNFTKCVQQQIKQYLDSISYDVNVMHEFTDGCSSQYKSRHCLGDLSFATTEYGYKVFHRNFFETSHAKGPQDAAGGFIKRQADIAVLRGNTFIQNAKDLFSFCNNDLKEPRSALFKRRIFRYVESVVRDNIRNFKPISNNLKIHHLYTSKSGEIVVSDLSCYTCDKCIVSDYEHCLHTEHTGQKRLVRPVEELGRYKYMTYLIRCGLGRYQHYLLLNE